MKIQPHTRMSKSEKKILSHKQNSKKKYSREKRKKSNPFCPYLPKLLHNPKDTHKCLNSFKHIQQPWGYTRTDLCKVLSLDCWALLFNHSSYWSTNCDFSIFLNISVRLFGLGPVCFSFGLWRSLGRYELSGLLNFLLLLSLLCCFFKFCLWHMIFFSLFVHPCIELYFHTRYNGNFTFY